MVRIVIATGKTTGWAQNMVSSEGMSIGMEFLIALDSEAKTE